MLCLADYSSVHGHQSLNVVFTGHCVWGGEANFVDSESGQKQNVKLLQNMVYTTTQHPLLTSPPPPHSHTLSVYTVQCTFSLGRGGEVREKVEGQQYTSIVPSSMEATVHKLGRKIPTMGECISSL